MFKCKLKIDGRLKKLSKKNGLHLKEIGEIFSKLAKCLENDNIKFTLTDIQDSSYTPVIETESEEGVEKFKAIHQRILTQPVEDLDFDEQEYAKTINKLLFERGIYIQAENDKDDKVIEVQSIRKGTGRYFSSITTITGKIVSIVGKNEKNPYITLETSQKKDYKVFISSEQENKLSTFYKNGIVRLRVKIKVDSWEHKEINASLFDFEIPEKRSFLDAIKETQKEFGDVFKHISDSAKLLRELRNENPPLNETSS